MVLEIIMEQIWTKSGDNWWMDVISDDAHKGSTDGDQADLFAY